MLELVEISKLSEKCVSLLLLFFQFLTVFLFSLSFFLHKLQKRYKSSTLTNGKALFQRPLDLIYFISYTLSSADRLSHYKSLRGILLL